MNSLQNKVSFGSCSSLVLVEPLLLVIVRDVDRVQRMRIVLFDSLQHLFDLVAQGTPLLREELDFRAFSRHVYWTRHTDIVALFAAESE